MGKSGRREFLKRTAKLGAALLPFVSRLNSASGQRRPNILFLFSDDQRFDTIHALGNKEIITPNMDRLVKRGTAFTHAFIMGSTRGAVCVCSRAMLLTGRTLYRAEPIEKGTTFPELLREHGYVTFGTGKWHNGRETFAWGFTRGAKIFFGGMSNHLQVPVYDFDPEGKYPKGKAYKGEKFSSELFSDAAIQFLREYDGKRPFLLYVAYTAPHDPRMAPEKYAKMYDPSKISLPKNFLPEHPFDNGEMKIRDEKLAPWPRTPEVVRKHIADYYAMITHLDAQIGRVLDALEQSGHAQNTIIIFSGDNGLAVGQHGLMGKQNLYEHSVRVPLVFCGPGIPQGKTSDALCYMHDIFPTICDLAGLPVPSTVEGKSLAPIISGKSRKVRDSVFGAYRNVQRMVREERFKLIEYFVRGKKTTQLFDLASDPWETTNLSSDNRYAETISRLRGELRQWQKKVDDPMADKWPA